MEPASILVIGPSWVGDMVLAQSLFKLLKQRHPDVAIDVAAPDWTLPLLERMPEVRKGIGLPFKHRRLDLAERVRIGRSLRPQGYGQAILLTNSFKSAILPFAAGITKRTGFVGEMRYGLLNDIRPLDEIAYPLTVQRFAALGLEAGMSLPDGLPLPALIPLPEQAIAVLDRLEYAVPETPVLGLCPGAEYGPAKRWPAERFAEVAKQALNQGQAVWLFGSDKDAPITRAINQMTGSRCLDLGGKTALGEAVDLMALTDAVVSNDSGLMHVAAAVNKPLVAIFGSSDPAHTPPMSDRAAILHLGFECSPCFQRECPLQHLNCLRNIQADAVISALDGLSIARG